ncbi:MAG: SprT family zinc-dependent metalloprotease [Alphaproteobacteria bacterium]|nr:SprT family zinc-dependent metalloprotease [Alphaproteobacteria bacterium]
MKGEYSVSGHPIIVQPNSRAKNLRLRYDTRKNFFSLTVPPRARLKDIQAFLERSQQWVEQRFKRQPDVIKLDHGATVSIFGQPHLIHFQKDIRDKVFIEQDRIFVCHKQRSPAEELEKFIKQQSLDGLSERAHGYVGQLTAYGAPKINKVSVRETHSRWGSCSFSKNLSFSWRLVLAPVDVADYVCAHEVAHLVHMDHSKAFWGVVNHLCPDHKNCRQWLKENGKHLFRYTF